MKLMNAQMKSVVDLKKITNLERLIKMFEYKAKILRIVDGDTMDVDIDCGFNIHFKERIRLLGVNTPETYGVKKESEEYKAGILAKEFVVNLCPVGAEVVIKTQKDKKGKYGRYIAEIILDNGENLNALLIAEGYGQEY